MVRRAMHYTPEVMLSAPRRSAGVPNGSGTTVLHTVSTYSFSAHSKTTSAQALDVKSGECTEIANDVNLSDFNWLDDERFVCLRAEKDGRTSIVTCSVKGKDFAVAGEVNASAGNLKICKLGDSDDYAVVLSAPATREGKLYTKEIAEQKTRSVGRLYDGLFVRHWDRYEGPEHNALWYGKLCKDGDKAFKLSDLTNALLDTGLESPIQPFGGTDHFDIRDNALIFVSKDPELNPALNTKCNVYLLRLDSWTSAAKGKLQKVNINGFEGASSSPVFNPANNSAAFLSMKTPGYEADKNQIFVIADIDAAELKAERAFSTSEAKEYQGTWNHSAGSLCFSHDGKNLIVTAEHEGTGRLYTIDGKDIQAASSDSNPRTLTKDGSVTDVRCLADGRIFVTGTSLIDNSWYAIVDPKAEAVSTSQPGCAPVGAWSHSNSSGGNKFGLKSEQISSIRTPASNPKVNKEVHSIVVRPSNYKKGEKYPVAYLIHGGPQGSWGDAWSTRWNPSVYAEQGYIVVAPNPTGSTGYGQEFTDSIRANWGGDPYQDIVNVFEWVGKNMEDADNDRAVALGASYGGYMVNWIQGHDLGRKFKAMVCHDGIFSFAGGLLPTEELYFPFYDLKGHPWDAPKSSDPAVTKNAMEVFGASSTSAWRKWDPSEYLSEWATPQLVIHSDKDYRLAMPEGLAAFNVLQTKGVESQFLTFPDENHWVTKPENGLVWHKVVLNWVNKFVGLPAYTDEDPNGEEFWGGIAEDEEDSSKMPIEGKPES